MTNPIIIENPTPKYDTINLIIFIVVFFIGWSQYVFIGLEYLKQHYPALLRLGLLKLSLWILPVILYLKYYDKVAPLTFLRLNGDIQKGWIYIPIVGVILLIKCLLVQYIVLNHIAFNPFFNTTTWINGVIVAGLTEEILFRGFILQKMNKLVSFRKANFITAVLFLFIHFPGWIHSSTFTAHVREFPGIFILGIVFGYVFKKSDSLLPCILIHSLNNFLAYSLNC